MTINFIQIWYLRDNNVNHLIVKIKYLLKNLSTKNSTHSSYTIKDLANIVDEEYRIIDKDSAKYQALKPLIYDKLFQSPEPESHLTVYESLNQGKTFFVQGKQNRYLISFD